MTFFWNDLHFLIPQINLLIGAILFLVYGAYFKHDSLRVLGILSLMITILSVYYIFCNISSDHKIFNNMLKINNYVCVMQIIILLSGASVIWNITFLKSDFITFEFIILTLISLVGMMFLISSNDLLSTYMSLELMSLPLYILAASNRESLLSSEAGIKYFILGAVSSGIFLFGSSLIYGATGTGNFSQIYLISSNESNLSQMFTIGMIFLICSMSFKIAAAPFHIWAPDVYQGSPTIATFLLATTPKIASLSLFIRILYEVFGQLSHKWEYIIILISIASMLLGSLGALIQSNIKRLLAFSSIGQMGFILMGLAVGGNSGLKGLLIYIIIYLVTIIGIFSYITLLKKANQISDLAGIAKTNPGVALGMTILLFSLAGIPPLSGFFAKFYILYAVIKHEMYILCLIAVIASIIATYYYIKIIKVIYFDQSINFDNVTMNLQVNIICIISVIFTLFYVLAPSVISNIAEYTVQSFL